jgi:phosphatidylglycerophosphatase A
MGTLAALLLVAATSMPAAVYLIVTAGAVVGGAYAAGRAEALIGQKDPGAIVVDEFAGYLVALAFLPQTAGYLVAGFILFRAFDILKPFPVRELQNLRGGMGVMADDVAAGLLANVALQLWRVLF